MNADGLESAQELTALDDAALKRLLAETVATAQRDRHDNQLLYYRPVSALSRQIHASRARVLGIGGGNRCIPLDAPVLMADSTWKPLNEIEVGDMVIAVDPVNGKGEPAPVLRTFRNGRQDVYRISFSDGGSFEATTGHFVPMYLGSGRTTSKGNGKRPHKRRLGHYIEPISRRGSRNASKRISCVSPGYVEFSNSQKPIAPYLLGALLGEGSLGSRSLKFSNTDDAVIARVRRHVENMGLRLHRYQGCDHGLVGERGQVNQAIALMKKLGLWGANSYTKFIPRCAFGWDKQDRLELLAGLIDTDGTADNYATCSPRLAEDVAMLVRSLGGKATISPKLTRDQRGTACKSFSIYLRLNERLPLSIFRKQRKNSKREVDYRRRVCRSAEFSRITDCGDIEVGHPSHCYVTGDYVVVSNSGKTELLLLEVVMAMTGVFPQELREHASWKFRGPINTRIVLESLTTTLHPVVLAKLQYWKWSGTDAPGGERGHWGWIPRWCLRDGSWERSWNERLRTLTVLCRDPDDLDRVMGESTLQIMSKDQDASDFASGEFHIVGHDEPPSLAIWRESEARVMSVAGRLIVAMTWPDDPAIPVDFIFDEIYEPGVARKNGIEWFNIYTTDNANLDQRAVAEQANAWSDETRRVRLFGQPIRFSHRVHPLFTDMTQHWCFSCGRTTISQANPKSLSWEDRYSCEACGGPNVCEFNHVKDFGATDKWPAVWLVDPHPRRAHRLLWAMVDPSDDIWVVADADEPGDPVDVRKHTDRVERNLGLRTVLRIMDPNMALSPSSAKRGVNWRDEFDAAGLCCELADDSHVGRERLNTFLRPDAGRWQPRIHVHPRCALTIFDLKRHVWDDYKRQMEKDQKQVPKDKNSDSPALLKYLMNHQPTFRGLSGSGQIFKRMGERRGAY